MVTCVRCLIAGRVQGVWFRASTKEKAMELGVRGWVRNLPDGRVEALLQGEAEAVEALKKWLWRGPTLAQVVDVQSEMVEIPEIQMFEVR
ncbi:Acylphosphatase [Nitrosococcus oceani ATCC 19707]|uniref:Acylphosphatase n=2 Tax=Nitrosococcus oceani TaxID=1229 RepID=ACYP_NITOC|nr:acylphosphatase [Nitrosococcus oceani]Q3JCP6.1 RecName: Full=Acylphosphatase; AltName: Full=Acylphosphate phosphohydrolase [Nitrosococcus oceani ATCC 19707]ABA57400.1 Acylphosphatase [Nitrosococcus oceani ATCC 19707]KFI20172.1 acylphosphatase [Nitrosococcus oceani C-27]GEM21551.1 acylphosphatase [Nitrosococcus oceani]